MDRTHDRVASLIRVFWVVSVVGTTTVCWWAVHRFGDRVGPWVAGLVALCVALAIHPAIVASNLVTSRIVSGPVPAAFRIGLGGMLGLFIGEVIASVRGFWLATPFLLHRPAARPSVARPDAIPILFIHGWFCNCAIWLSFMKEAASRGHVCEAMTLPFQFESIESNADAVDAAIDALLARKVQAGVSVKRVAIVAHSMGGLVARAALLRIDASRVAQVITLGTPHHGTWMSRSGTTTNVRQMQLDSAWLRDLDEAERRDAGRIVPRRVFTTLFSHHDNIVFPQTTAVLDGASVMPIAGVGHVALAYDRRVRSRVFAALDRGPLPSEDQAAVS